MSLHRARGDATESPSDPATGERNGRIMTRSSVMLGLLLLAASVTIGIAGDPTSTARVTARDDASDVARLIDALEVGPGSTIADIGAGAGELTVAMARHVGPSGRVYSSELGSERLEELEQAVETAGLDNVTVIKGHANRTNLPNECCDALFMRRVYHHFADPAAMNASLWQSLKPSGRLAVIDFPPDGDESAAPSGRAKGDQHGVTAETVERELEEAAFELLSIDEETDGDFMVIVRKPMIRCDGTTRRMVQAVRHGVHGGLQTAMIVM
ncbi:MAG: methyltransferase domain-containing protein [Luteitalea sp.]|nr:methyltransferase domain-containing protein [Luteitalea sp.]